MLAAGRGLRLKPFTLTRPKHMLPIGGAPLLRWLLKGLQDIGIDRILLVTNYKEKIIRRYFGDGSDLKIKIKYEKQDKICGTADAFKVAERFTRREDFLGINGDLFVSRQALKAVIEAYEKGTTTIAVVPVEDPSQYGAVELEGDQVKKIVEKPSLGDKTSCFVNAGIYVFTRDIYELIRGTKPSRRLEYEITDSLRNLIEAKGNLKAVKLTTEGWLDIGLPWNLIDANERSLASMESSMKGVIEDGAYINGTIVIEREARIRSGSYIEGPVFVGEGSDIGPNCYIRPYTSIGSNVRIGNSCEVKNSIIMDGTHIAHLSYVGDSIIGEKCNFGAGTITANIRFDKKTIRANIEGKQINSGRRKLGALIGDLVQTGINVSIMPGVKINPGICIAPGEVVYKDPT